MFTKSRWENTFLYKVIFNERGEVGSDDSGSDDSGDSAPEAGEVEVDSDDSSDEVAVVEGEEGESGGEAVQVQADTEEELEAEIQEAIGEGASEEEVKDMIREFTLKVNGKEIVKKIDLNDEDAVIKELQMAAAGQKSMQELAEIKKLYSSELKRLQDDPFGVLKELNPDFDPLNLSASYIDKVLKESEMSPEDKASAEKDRKFDEILKENERLKKSEDDREKSIQIAQLEQEIESDIMSAIESDSELTADADTVALIAEHLIWASNTKGYEDKKAADFIPSVKKQLRDQFRNAAKRFKSTTALKEYMGDDLLEKLREERVEQAKKQIKNVKSLKQNGTVPEENKTKPKEKIMLSTLFK